MIEAWTSALTPASPQAESLATLSWILIYGLGAVFVIVMLLTLFAVFLRRRSDEKSVPPFGHQRFIVGGGIVFPSLVLVTLLIYALILTGSLRAPTEALSLRVTGHMWWWDVRYLEEGVTIANEIYVPVGRPVRIELEAKDVIHSLWIPSLGGKTDLIPGLRNVHWFEAKKPGRYWGQCAEFCGVQHARMALYVVALPPEEFDAWLSEKRKPLLLSDEPRLAKGWKIFERVGCAECHSIRGLPAEGAAGPDLTHIGSRLSLGAGTVPNNFGNLAGWIADPQALKPGNKMPPTSIDPHELHQLVDFLMRLR